LGVTDYSSDFLDFSNNGLHTYQSEQFSISLSGINNVGGGQGITIDPNGYLDSFTANGTGTFSSNPVPPAANPTPPPPPPTTPEPSALGLLPLGAVVLGSMRRRRN